jgi:hypothetical protein
MIYGVIEILRRAMWGVFRYTVESVLFSCTCRVENEHLNNCDKFRAIQDVPLPTELREKATQDNPLLKRVKKTLNSVRKRNNKTDITIE